MAFGILRLICLFILGQWQLSTRGPELSPQLTKHKITWITWLTLEIRSLHKKMIQYSKWSHQITVFEFIPQLMPYLELITAWLLHAQSAGGPVLGPSRKLFSEFPLSSTSPEQHQKWSSSRVPQEFMQDGCWGTLPYMFSPCSALCFHLPPFWWHVFCVPQPAAYFEDSTGANPAH